jgi:hypothetical protein
MVKSNVQVEMRYFRFFNFLIFNFHPSASSVCPVLSLLRMTV